MRDEATDSARSRRRASASVSASADASVFSLFIAASASVTSAATPPSSVTFLSARGSGLYASYSHGSRPRREGASELPGQWHRITLDIAPPYLGLPYNPKSVSYTHLTLPTNREV